MGFGAKEQAPGRGPAKASGAAVQTAHPHGGLGPISQLAGNRHAMASEFYYQTGEYPRPKLWVLQARLCYNE